MFQTVQHRFGPHYHLIAADLIMRTTTFWLAAAAAGAAVYAIPLAGAAQQSTDAVPPRLEQLEEGDAPADPDRQPEPQREVAEKRAPGGRVTEITVGSGKSKYYLKPGNGSGYTSPDAQGSSGRAAQWEIMQFDLRRPKNATGETPAKADVPPPPPAK